MFNSKKLVSLILALVLSLSVVSVSFAATASDRSFSGTSWACTKVDLYAVDWSSVDRDTRDFFALLDMCVNFVPSRSRLSDPSICSIYLGIKFRSDHTCTIETGMSMFGQIEDDATQSLPLNWYVSGGTLYLSLLGSSVPVEYNGRTISLDLDGAKIVFQCV